MTPSRHGGDEYACLVRRFFRAWLDVSISTWLLRVGITLVGITIIMRAQGWVSTTPLVLLAAAVAAMFIEAVRKRRNSARVTSRHPPL